MSHLKYQRKTNKTSQKKERKKRRKHDIKINGGKLRREAETFNYILLFN